MTIWRRRIEYWMTKANAHSDYATLAAVLLKQWLHERTLMLRYTYTGRPV
jgi:hypothetical protein